MELLQITANFPGKGNVDVLASPDLAEPRKCSTRTTTPTAISATVSASAFLVPYPNRIRGKLSADGKTLTTEWQGHTSPCRQTTSAEIPAQSATPCTASS